MELIKFGGALINPHKINYIVQSSYDTGHARRKPLVIIHFDNERSLTVHDKTVDALLKAITPIEEPPEDEDMNDDNY